MKIDLSKRERARTADTPEAKTAGVAVSKSRGELSGGQGAPEAAVGRSGHGSSWERVWALRLAGVLVFCLGVASIGGMLTARWVVGQLADLAPELNRLEKAPRTLKISGHDLAVIGYDGVYQGRDLSAVEIPDTIRWAVLAAEDRRFYDHPGIDYMGILRAAWRNFRSGEIVEGGSTISQQLVKKLFLTEEKTMKRKVHEAALAIEMEKRYSKDHILTHYLNTVYFGAGAYGIDAAAQRYFSKDVGRLTLGEAALLAGLIKSPSVYDPFRNLHAAHQRARAVLVSMYNAGFVSGDEAFSASALLPVPQRRARPIVEAGYFRDYVTSRANDQFADARGDLEVVTTLDTGLQQLAAETLRDVLEKQGPAANASQAALVALSRDGAILAMVGGRDYDESQFNRAVQARRQPGSLFKGFVYLAALENGWRPNSLLYDEPITVDGWSPDNYEDIYYGRITLASAFAKSANSVAVQLQEDIGRRAVIDMARRLGLDSPLPAYPSLALGTAETTLLDITGAYAAMAENDTHLEPYAIRSVTRRGQEVYAHRGRAPEPAYHTAQKDMLHLLRSTSLYGTAGRVRRVGTVYAKTGTSQDYRDAWFVGFTGKIVVGVWVGNDDNKPMKRISGGNLPAEIWARYVEQAHPLVPDTYRPVPTKLVADVSGAIREVPAARDRVVEDAESGNGWIVGQAQVIDTAVLTVDGIEVHLEGVEGFGGKYADEMRRFVAGRPVRCQFIGGDVAECWMGGTNLSVAVVYNGGGRAARGAPARVREAEARARAEERGVWEPIRHTESDFQRTAYLPGNETE